MDFRTARDFLLSHRQDYATAYRDFEWPQAEHFNWALDWFDSFAKDNDRPGLWIVDDDGSETILSFAELASHSDALASWLRDHGVRRGDRTLLMLGNRAALWESILALTKLGAVIIPSTTLLTASDIEDRVTRGHVAHVIAESAQAGHFTAVAGDYTRIAVGDPVEGWLSYDDFRSGSSDFRPDGPTAAGDPLFLYFTSGTTAQPKLVEHTHVSYPVGHLSTMYWIALQPGDVHLNLSSPGWAKHAWSNVFAPWNAEATVLILNAARFSATRLLDTLTRCSVTSFCAPPTVWRMLIQEEVNELRREEHELEERTDRLALASGLTLILSIVALIVGAAALTIALINGTSDRKSSAPAAAQAPGASNAGATKPAPAPAAAGKVDVKLGEMFVRPNAQVVRAGKVTLTVANTGKLTHEMIVERTPVTLDPSGKANEGHSSGEVPELQPGKSGNVTLQLKPGTYQLFCNVPGHYAAGQHTNITVTKG